MKWIRMGGEVGGYGRSRGSRNHNKDIVCEGKNPIFNERKRRKKILSFFSVLGRMSLRDQSPLWLSIQQVFNNYTPIA